MSIYDVMLLLAVAIGLFFAIRAICKGKTSSCSGNCMNCSKNCKK